MKKIFLLSAVTVAMLLGCANAQQQVAKKEVKQASRVEVCQNCMAQFKASLGMQKFTQALLYKQCPACKPIR